MRVNKNKMSHVSMILAGTVLAGTILGTAEPAMAIEKKSVANLTAGVTYVINDEMIDGSLITAGLTSVTISALNNNTVSQAAPESLEDIAKRCGYTNLGMSVVTEGNLNIRETPATDGKIVGKMTNHNACQINSVEGEWTNITSGEVTGYVMSSYLLTGEEALKTAGDEIRRVALSQTDGLRVRTSPGTDSGIIAVVATGEALTLAEEEIKDGWICVDGDDQIGYVSSEFATVTEYLPTAKTITEFKYGSGVSDVRAEVVEYATQFVGNRYVWGGTSLTNGVDCSGFTMQVFAKYGISLPHSSKAQPSYGTKIDASEAQPGDLFFYGSGRSINHVAIYMGDGQIVHASNKKDGIKISNAFYRSPVCVVRYFD